MHNALRFETGFGWQKRERWEKLINCNCQKRIP